MTFSRHLRRRWPGHGCVSRPTAGDIEWSNWALWPRERVRRGNNAQVGGESGLRVDGRQHRFAAAEPEGLLGQLGDGGCAVLTCEGRSDWPAITIIRHALGHQVNEKRAPALVVWRTDVDRLLNGYAVAERAHWVLAAADRCLVGGLLRNRDPFTVGPLPSDQLVDHAGGGGAGTGDDGGSDAVRVDGRG